MAKLMCFIGNFDGRREGLVVAGSQSAAAKIAGAPLSDFRDHWEEEQLTDNFEPKPLTLYTRPYCSNADWQIGHCDLGQKVAKSELRTEEGTYPNGTKYLNLIVHNQVIGTATKVEGGYLTFGRRKPVATLQEAAKQCIDSKMSQHRNEIEKLRDMLHAVLRK